MKDARRMKAKARPIPSDNSRDARSPDVRIQPSVSPIKGLKHRYVDAKVSSSPPLKRSAQPLETEKTGVGKGIGRKERGIVG